MVVETNNKLRQEEIKEKEEIEKILVRLSSLVAENKDYILANIKALYMLDFAFAKASFAIEIDGRLPKL